MLCNQALQSTQVARSSTRGRPIMDTAGKQVCYKEETPVLTGLEKLVGPAMTALPSVGELQTGQDIGGSQSCCSRTPALHLPVRRERRVQMLLAEGKEQNSSKSRWEKTVPLLPSDLDADNIHREINSICHWTGYSDPEVTYRSACCSNQPPCCYPNPESQLCLQVRGNCQTRHSGQT